MTDTHFAGWPLGRRMHTHIGRCIKCGSSDGQSIVCVRLTRPGDGLALQLDGVSNRLCPHCKAKYRPLSPAMREELDRLSGKLWRDLRKRGCPCCEAGFSWYPAEQVH